MSNTLARVVVGMTAALVVVPFLAIPGSTAEADLATIGFTFPQGECSPGPGSSFGPFTIGPNLIAPNSAGGSGSFTAPVGFDQDGTPLSPAPLSSPSDLSSFQLSVTTSASSISGPSPQTSTFNYSPGDPTSFSLNLSGFQATIFFNTNALEDDPKLLGVLPLAIILAMIVVPPSPSAFDTCDQARGLQ